MDIHKDILIKLALELDLPSLYSLCRTSKKLSFLCESKEYWKLRLLQDYKIVDNVNPKYEYKQIGENSDQCNMLLLAGEKKEEDYVLDMFNTNEYFKRKIDFLAYRFILNKLLDRKQETLYYDNFLRHSEYSDTIEDNDFPSQEEYQLFLSLLNEIKKKLYMGSFRIGYDVGILNSIQRGTITPDIKWGELCQTPFY